MLSEGELERFLDKIDKHSSDGCWLWTASLDGRGYGQFGIRRNGKNKNCRAHRISYVHYRGPIPEGMELHHNCEVKRCVNPAHLVVCSHKENMSSGKWGKKQEPRCVQWQKQKTHCPKGHELSGDNLYVYPDGRRQCQTCRRDAAKQWARKYRAEHPEEAKAYAKAHYEQNRERKNEVRRQWRARRRALGLPHQ